MRRKGDGMYLILLVLWFIFSGKVTLEIALFGLVICSWLYWFMSKYMDYNVKKDIAVVKKIPLFLLYGVTLVIEVIKSNLAVIRIVLSPGLECEPTFVTFHTDLKSEVSRVTLANSITLTPGTYTCGLEENEYTIHALDKKFTEGIDESVFVKQLRKLEE